MTLVLNALRFSARALYLMPEYLSNKPVELLIDHRFVRLNSSTFPYMEPMTVQSRSKRQSK